YSPSGEWGAAGRGRGAECFSGVGARSAVPVQIGVWDFGRLWNS
ncbi:MAG: hypothetical protein HW399_723, partial [Dehalococcoidia bacterium]|nr:hypothetical protein [Dehalococcoidia bacterium]